MPTLMDEVRAGYARGWSFTPLDGKRPILTAWASQPRPTLEQCLEWAERGNVGLRTGTPSGVVVIDVDGAGVELDGLPPTWTVLSGRGGRHYYFAIEPGGLVGNSQGKLAPKIDTRGEGGQVVFAGSLHPDSRNTYAWAPGMSPDEIPLAMLPVDVLPEAMRRRYRAGVLRAGGKSIRDIAAILQCSKSAVSRDLGENDDETDKNVPLSQDGTTGGTAGGTPVGQGVPGTVPNWDSGSGANNNGVPNGTPVGQGVPKGVPARVPGGTVGTPPSAPPTPPSAPSGPPASEMTPRQKQVFAREALAREVDTLTNQPSGGRNHQLNEAAMKLGSLIPGGWLDESEIRSQLRAACTANGLITDDGEHAFQATVESGLSFGKSTPRVFPMARRAPEDHDTKYALVPGNHVDRSGVLHEVTHGDFVRDVLSRIPDDYLYRRDRVAGLVTGTPGERQFVMMSSEYGKSLLGMVVKPGQWKSTGTGKNKERQVVYKAFSTELVNVISACVGEGGEGTNIESIVPYPMPNDRGELPRAGINLDGTYYDEPESLRNLEPVRDVTQIHRILHEPICDFPFKDNADRDNFIGLMLTPLVRRMIRSCVPMHIIDASTPGSGKTRLIEQVFGITMLGSPLAGSTWPDREEEARKVILSTLISGKTLWHLDNVKDTISSASLASYITASHVCDRVLSTNTVVTLPNRTTVIANGNNVRMNTDMARRAVYIRLEPNTDRPSNRTNFKHSDLAEYVLENRRHILAALIGMIQNWIAANSPPHMLTMGSFERWSKIVGGILAFHGYSAWRTNENEFRSQTDDFGADFEKLVTVWEVCFNNRNVKPTELMAMCKEQGLFYEYLAGASSDHGRAIAFGRLVLHRIVGRVFGRWKVTRIGAGSSSLYKLTPLWSPPTTGSGT